MRRPGSSSKFTVPSDHPALRRSPCRVLGACCMCAEMPLAHSAVGLFGSRVLTVSGGVRVERTGSVQISSFLYQWIHGDDSRNDVRLAKLLERVCQGGD